MNRIKELRTKAHITQIEFSKMCNISQGALSGYETGRYEPDLNTLSKMADYFNVSIDYLLCRSNEHEEPSTPVPNNVIHIRKKRIPVLGTIAAGVPIYADEQHDEYITADEDDDVDFALIVQGDSMEPRLLDGDIVMFRAQDDVYDGQIAAVIIGDEATLKRLYHMPNAVQLISENPKYKPMMFRENVRILGVAKYYRRKL